MTSDLCLYHVFSGTSVHQALTAAQHCHPVMAPSAAGEPTAARCIARVVDSGSTRRLNVTLVCGCLFMEVSIRAALGARLARRQRPLCRHSWGRRKAFCVSEEDRAVPPCVSVSLPGSHYSRQNVVVLRGDPQPLEMRAVAAICCTLESDLQLNSISSPSLCHSAGRGRKATIRHWSTTGFRGKRQIRKVNVSTRFKNPPERLNKN